MTVRTKYWLCQLGGWGSYSVLGLTVAALNAGWSAPLATGFALFFAYSVALTEGFRQIIRRGRWLEPPVRFVWLRLIAGSLVISTIQFTLVIAIDAVLSPGNTHWPLDARLGLAWGLAWATWGWTALYVGLTRKRRTQTREVALELSLREAELRALQRQINPHFLFNCLNSMRGLIGEDPRRAQQMVTTLAEMLRYNLQREPRETTPLAAELKVVTDYLALEGVRFEDRLRVRFDIDPALTAIEIPSMLLPTLVENAVTHGISALPTGGDVDIHAWRDGRTLRIEVTNSGQLQPPRTDSVGLVNLRERLRLLYGDRARLDLDQSGARVVAAVTMPIE
jgi:hypothetical protein